MIALFDLNRLEILRIDDHGVVPIPPESGNFDVAAGAPLRDDIAPLEITQPDGPGFTLDGHVLTWQRWQVHVGFTPREGLVLNQVAYDDGGRLRSILYRASLSEMVVPYGDPSPTHYFKNAFDGGENGVGIAASPLTRGCDCLGEIVYLDAIVSDGAGDPVQIPNAICIHEEDAGVLWRHVEWRDGSGEVRRSRRLVISSFSAIGNYDYGFFWYLYQDGTIAFEVKLTGVLSTGAVAPGERPAHGTLVAPGLNAMVHQHFFNMRLDLDIDGQANAVEEVWTESLPPGPATRTATPSAPAGGASPGNSKPSAGSTRPRPAGGRSSTPDPRHRLGEPIGYRLLPGETTIPFAQPDAPVSKRAGFIREHLWVTPYRPDERYAAGEYPNLHPGGAGLPEWTSADRPDRRPRRRRLVHVRPPSRAAARGLADHAGHHRRLLAQAGRLLQEQSPHSTCHRQQAALRPLPTCEPRMSTVPRTRRPRHLRRRTEHGVAWLMTPCCPSPSEAYGMASNLDPGRSRAAPWCRAPAGCRAPPQSPSLHDPPAEHDDDPIGQLAHDCEVVADQQVRDARRFADVGEEIQDLRLDGDVQRRHRLVQDQHLRLGGERAGDCDSLALTP